MNQNGLDVSVFEQGVPQFLSGVSWFGDVSEQHVVVFEVPPDIVYVSVAATFLQTTTGDLCYKRLSDLSLLQAGLLALSLALQLLLTQA